MKIQRDLFRSQILRLQADVYEIFCISDEDHQHWSVTHGLEIPPLNTGLSFGAASDIAERALRRQIVPPSTWLKRKRDHAAGKPYAGPYTGPARAKSFLKELEAPVMQDDRFYVLDVRIEDIERVGHGSACTVYQMRYLEWRSMVGKWNLVHEVDFNDYDRFWGVFCNEIDGPTGRHVPVLNAHGNLIGNAKWLRAEHFASTALYFAQPGTIS